jgi:parallel beta-helix repeat protein
MDLQDLVDSNPAGTTFLLEAGVHRNQEIASREGNVFVGEPGAVMDGGGTTPFAFHNDVDDVTIVGLVIENYANPAQRGAIDSAGSAWRVIGNEIRFNAGAAINIRGDDYLVQGNHIHHNEQIGVVGRGANGRIENNEIAHNNHNDRYEMSWEAGGTKFLHSTRLHIANNFVHDNHGPGLWTDDDNYLTVVENNIIRDNYGPGILHEISYDATIRDNTVTNNAHRFYTGGILVANSSNVEVFDNTVTGNSGGIVGIQDERGSGPRGEFATTGLDVHDNIVAYSTGWTGVRVNSGTDVTQTGSITFNHNSYTTDMPRPFFWATAEQTIQEWLDLGHDNDSTIN